MQHDFSRAFVSLCERNYFESRFVISILLAKVRNLRREIKVVTRSFHSHIFFSPVKFPFFAMGGNGE